MTEAAVIRSSKEGVEDDEGFEDEEEDEGFEDEVEDEGFEDEVEDELEDELEEPEELGTELAGSAELFCASSSFFFFSAASLSAISSARVFKRKPLLLSSTIP